MQMRVSTVPMHNRDARASRLVKCHAAALLQRLVAADSDTFIAHGVGVVQQIINTSCMRRGQQPQICLHSAKIGI